jgi:hypothetical protein
VQQSQPSRAEGANISRLQPLAKQMPRARARADVGPMEIEHPPRVNMDLNQVLPYITPRECEARCEKHPALGPLWITRGTKQCYSQFLETVDKKALYISVSDSMAKSFLQHYQIEQSDENIHSAMERILLHTMRFACLEGYTKDQAKSMRNKIITGAFTVPR